MGSIFKSKPSSEDHQQGPNHCTSSSGVIMDEPYASERAEVTLVQPAAIEDGGESTSCYVDIDSSHLRGYFLTAIELISSSRTVELYSSPNQDYIGTSRGSLMEKREDGTKIYSTQFELPSDLHSSRLSLKLLSLQGRTEVMVTEINVIVTEDHGGVRLTSSGEQSSHIGIELPPAGPGFDLQQMLQSVGAAQNVPPFLKSLASSLQMLQLHQPPKPPSRATSWGDTTPNVTTGGAVSSLPMELAQMMDAFKQMRPPSPNEAEAAQPTSENGEGGDERAGGQEEVTSDQSSVNENKNITKLLDERISELEKRLLGYVDSKLAELEKRLLSELGNLSQRIDTLHHAQPDSGNEQCHINNGAVLSLPLSDDQQLD